MADDIDIEEHDILNNPQIANIKTEPVEYEDNYEEYSGVDYENYPVKLEPMDCDEQTQHDETTNEQQTQHDETDSRKVITENNLHSNRIILGRKPCPKKPRPGPMRTKLKALFISLEDWGERLNTSRCYCKECKILFATRNAIDAHKMAVHSFLVPVESSVQEEEKEESPQTNLRFCNHCNTYFADENVLIQHLYDLIQAKQKSKEKAAVNKSIEKPVIVKQSEETIKEEDGGNTGKYLCCEICSCYFITGFKFNKHCNRTHGICRAVPVTVEGKFVCKFCNTILKTYLSYNRHIRFHHTRKYLVKKKDIVSKARNINNHNKYKCIECNLIFNDLNLAKMHQRNHHKKQNKIVVKSVVQRKAVYKTHMPRSRLRSSLDCGIVPKNVLFKCDKCPTHFLNCFTVLCHLNREHTPQSSIKVWECPDCNRMFRDIDRELHQLQHQNTSGFKVYVTHENIYARVLCRCATCDTYFEERIFLRHTKTGCEAMSQVEYCSLCKLNIYNSLMHNQRHMEKTDFILIKDFIQSKSLEVKTHIADTTKSTMKRKGDSEILEKHPKKKMLVPMYSTPKLSDQHLKALYMQNKFPVYYCSNCRTYLRSNVSRLYHVSKKCNNDQSKRFLCRMCGLFFSWSRQLQRHKLQHSQKNFQLKNFVIICIKTLKPCSPPLPEFHKCKKCGVQYLNNHKSCIRSECITCGVCKKRFNDVAFALHTQHHKYIRPVAPITSITPTSHSIENTLKMKYEMLKPTWNILYNCEVCDVTTDSYDDVIDHSQKHFNDMQSFDVTIQNCEECALNFEDKCYKKHQELHFNQEIDRNSFTILKYDYAKLLTDDWLQIFGQLPKEKMAQIMNRSIYVTRVVKMTMLQNGPPEYTIYKCQNCDKIVARHEISMHTIQNSCAEQPIKHLCNFCCLAFATEKAKDEHVLLHNEQSVTANSFRVVAFNHPDERGFNSKLRTQFVEKTLHKYNPEQHNVSQSYKKITYYRCEKCYSCMLSKFYIKRHECDEERNMCICRKCNNVFLWSTITLHNKRHDKGMTADDIVIKPFNQDIKPGERRFKISKCQKCHVKAPTYLLKYHQCIQKEKKIPQPMLTMTLYRCPICKSVFSDKENLEKHTETCGCNEGDNKSTNLTKIYKCKICSLFMLSSTSAKGHTHNEIGAKRCKQCGWKFSSWTLKRHVIQHHETSQLTPNDFNIILICGKGKHPNEKFVTSNKTKAGDEDCGVIRHDESAEDVIGNNNTKPVKSIKNKILKKLNETKETLVDEISESDKTIDTNHDDSQLFGSEVEDDKSKNKLFRCGKCDLHYLNTSTWVSHIQSNHVVHRGTDNCKKCGLKFTHFSLRKHKVKHPKCEKVKPIVETPYESLVVTKTKITESKSDNTFNESVVSQSSNDTEECISKFDETIDTNDDDSQLFGNEFVDDKSKNILFRCGKCDLHYLNMRTLEHHVQSSHVVHRDTDNCRKCGLKFTRVSLKHHNVKHPRCEIVKPIVETLKESLVDTKTKVTEVFNEIVVSQSIDDTEESISKSDEIQSVRDEESTSQTKVSPTASTSKKCTHKIYKCGQCNVHFMSQSTCYSHMLRHTPIDPKDFIECKLCNLPFKIISLNSHIRKHHNGDFNLDEVLVEEYTNNGGKTPKIEIYYAIDKVQSRLVSTTSDEPNLEPDLDSKPSSSNVDTNESVQTSQDISIIDVDEVKCPNDEETNNLKTHKCQFCGEVFKSNTSKEFHESLDHLDGEKNCMICDKSFNASILNELHLSIKDGTFECCVCAVRIDLKEMSQHALVH